MSVDNQPEITPTPEEGNDTNKKEKDYKPFLGAEMSSNEESFKGDEYDDV